MKSTRSLISYFLGIVFFSGAVFVNSTFAQSCSGAGCEGLMPTSTTCYSDSTSVGFLVIRDWNTQAVGSVDLMYSAACQTVWSEVNSYYPASSITAEIGGGSYPVYPVPGAYSTTLYGGPYPAGVYYAISPMKYAPTLTPQVSATGSFTATVSSIFNCDPGEHGDCTPVENSFWGSASYGSYQF